MRGSNVSRGFRLLFAPEPPTPSKPTRAGLARPPGFGAAAITPGVIAAAPNPGGLANPALVGFEGVGGSGANNSLNPRDTFEPRMLNQSLISPTRNYNVYLQGSYDLQ